jgi:hypothetical protein
MWKECSGSPLAYLSSRCPDFEVVHEFKNAERQYRSNVLCKTTLKLLALLHFIKLKKINEILRFSWKF